MHNSPSLTLALHSRPQRPRSFWSAPRIATSGQVQHWKSAIHGLPVTLRMLRVKSDKSDWFWSQSIVFTKSIQNRNVVEPGQRSRFLVLTNRSAASGYENDSPFDPKRNFCSKILILRELFAFIRVVSLPFLQNNTASPKIERKRKKFLIR